MSFSKIFKAPQLLEVEEVKVITQPVVPVAPPPTTAETEPVEGDWEQQTREEMDKLMRDAREQAQAIIEQAIERARSIEAEVEEKVDLWWQENRVKLDKLSMEAKRQGYEEGFRIGSEQGLMQVQEEYQSQIDQARQLLTEAYEEKQTIIAEAEPFLLEVSVAIAEQIMRQELASYPDKFIQLIQQRILRFKEKDSITICVHPEDFPFVQSHRGSLQASVNGDTEIKVIPDHSVTLQGCMIRTAYGSVDARIDTQLDEIKKVLFEVGKEPEHAVGG